MIEEFTDEHQYIYGDFHNKYNKLSDLKTTTTNSRDLHAFRNNLNKSARVCCFLFSVSLYICVSLLDFS